MRTTKYLLLALVALSGVAAGPKSCQSTVSSPAITSNVLDPRATYDDRFRMFQMLKASHPYPDGWTDHRDGIGIQAQWQVDSGRDVEDASGQLYAWWPNVNWTLVVWPFVVLQQHRGEFSQFAVLQHEGWKSYRFMAPSSVVQSVLAYYDELDYVRSLSEAGQINWWNKPWYEANLQKLLWDFHHKAVVTGMDRNKDLLAGLEVPGPTFWGFPTTDKGERMFAESWGTMVGILKAVRFPTSSEIVTFFNYQALPGVWVKENDYKLSKPSSLGTSQRLTLIALWNIHKFEQKWGNPIYKLLTYLASIMEDTEALVEIVAKAIKNGGSGFGLWKSLAGFSIP